MELIKPILSTFSLRKFIPSTYWLPRYKRQDFLPDLIAGITVGLTLIPQSIAYASLAGLEPQRGLYSAFLGTFVYILFGTVKEVNLGPKALLSLLTFNYTYKLGPLFAVLLCFLSGCVELICGILQLGFLVNFVSGPVILSFTWASVIVIASAQIKGLLGLTFSSENVFQTWQGVFLHLNDIKIPDAVLGISCCVILILLKEMKERLKVEDKRVKKLIWFISTAKNALVVLICSIIASILENYGNGAPFKLTGQIVSGLPNFQLPPFSYKNGNNTMDFIDMSQELGSGIIVVPIIAIISNLAIGRAFAQGKMLDATQEMIALGLCNIAGSMVGSMPVAGAFSRSAISNASGVRTPLAGLYTGIMVLLSLSLLTPYFYYIPRPTLSAVVACAVISLIDTSTIKPMWKSCKLDIVTCIVTFIGCLSIGLDLGLLLGVIFDIMVVLIATSRPKIQTNIVKHETNLSYLLITPKSGLTFTGADHLRSTILSKFEELNIIYSCPVVINFEYISSLDFTAGQSIKSLQKDLKKLGHDLILYKVKDNILNKIKVIINDHIVHHVQSEKELQLLVADL